MLHKSPGFTTVAVLTLALGIGANTAVFSLVNAVLMRPLAYPNSDRLVWLSNYDEGWGDGMVQPAAYALWKSAATCFESMIPYGTRDAALMSAGESTQEMVASIGDGFWEGAGARSSLGRLFTPGESNTIVLSHQLFRRRFGGDPNVIGRSVALNGHAFTIAGVLPESFQFLFPQEPTSDERSEIDAYIPLPNATMKVWSVTEQQFESLESIVGPTPWAVYVVGKLKPGATFAQARAEMEAIFEGVRREHYPSWQQDTKLHIAPLKDRVTGNARVALLSILGAVCFVLLIACANIANLLLARASTRQQEFAIRVAMGAGAARLIRQLVVESVLMTFLGGAFGLALARAALTIVIRLGTESIPRIGDARLNWQVLLLTFAISLATGLLFGLVPALAIPGRNLQDALKKDAGWLPAGARHLRIRELLSTAELALAIVLLTGAGLMVKSFWEMTVYPPGFVPEKILTMGVSLYGQKYATLLQKDAYIRELLRRIEAVPDVAAAGIHQGTLTTAIKIEGAPPSPPGKEPYAAIQGVSAGYLRAMGVRLIRGSWPAEDSFDTFIVNSSFAREMFGNEDPIGKHISGAIMRGTIVGVVPDLKISRLDAQPSPEVYVPYQLPPGGQSLTVVVRTQNDPKPVTSLIRAVASQVDASQPIYEFQTLEHSLQDSIAPRRFNLFLLGAFAAMAVALAMVGVYGVMAYFVSQRTREIGIRLALGAQRGDMMNMVIKKGLRMALIGVGAGVVVATGLTRLIAALLFGVTPHDPLTFAVVTFALILAALAACWIPARRAMRVDPMIALRHE